MERNVENRIENVVNHLAPLPIKPLSETEFFTILNTSLVFEKDEEHRIVAVAISQSGNQINAKKLPQ
ncbi:MAG: hypothetical protein AAF702_14790 [Chloroflexota bacterium]